MNEIETQIAKLKADIRALLDKTQETVAGQEAIELLDEVRDAVKEHIELTK